MSKTRKPNNETKTTTMKDSQGKPLPQTNQKNTQGVNIVFWMLILLATFFIIKGCVQNEVQNQKQTINICQDLHKEYYECDKIETATNRLDCKQKAITLQKTNGCYQKIVTITQKNKQVIKNE